ncbi:hypothetical protein BGX34_004908 [Mortierella sp. NVP85]|nr:hypothetical protein BGX34_004908 [Mortierella sp. NVP85]
MSPHTGLMDYPPLAYLTNAYLTALNSLRLLAPLSLAIPLREILVDSLIHVDLALEEYDRFIFGERPSAFRSTLLARRHGSTTTTAVSDTERNDNDKMEFKMQGMEGSVILNEQKIMDDFMMEYKHAVQGYILKCFDEGIYGGLIHVDLDMDLGQDSLDTATTEVQEQGQEQEQEQEQEQKQEPKLETELDQKQAVDAPSTSTETTGPFILPGIGAAMSMLLLHGARREAVIRLLVWMAIGLFVYVVYGRTHSEINNPRLDPMPVLHESTSAENLNNYQGYTDEDLRRQYSRQRARRMGYDRRQRYSGLTMEECPPITSTAPGHGGVRPDVERRSENDTMVSGMDNGHGVGAFKREDSVSIVVLSDIAAKESSSSPSSPRSLQPLQPRLGPHPEPAHVSSRIA